MDKPQNSEAAETVQTTETPAVDLPRLVLPFDFKGWVTPPDGDGCGWMAFPMDGDNPDGFWEVTDCEGDRLCVCQKETAVWLHMLLNKIEPSILNQNRTDRVGYCKRIAAEMAEGNAGMGGSWDEFIRENDRR